MLSLFWSSVDSAKQKWNADKRTLVAYSAATTIISISTAIMLAKYIKKQNLQKKLQEFEEESIKEDKVILHMIPKWDFPTPHPSPYCAKMIAFLELNKIAYSIDSTVSHHFYTQKMPWITYKNHHQPDSNLIIEWFKNQKEFNYINIDSHLTEKQLAISDAYKSMIEDGLMWILRYRRFSMHENAKIFLKLAYGTLMPPVKQKIILHFVIPNMSAILFWMVGIGRYKPEEVYKKGEDLIKCVVVYMGNNRFFFGDKLSTLDISIYAHIGGLYQLCSVMTWGLTNEIPSKLPFMQHINDYMKRIEIECFGKVKYWKDMV